MSNTSNLFCGARKAIGLSTSAIAQMAGVSDKTYSAHENENNEMFRLQELKPLYLSADEQGRKLVMNAIEQFFCLSKPV